MREGDVRGREGGIGMGRVVRREMEGRVQTGGEGGAGRGGWCGKEVREEDGRWEEKEDTI